MILDLSPSIEQEKTLILIIEYLTLGVIINHFVIVYPVSKNLIFSHLCEFWHRQSLLNGQNLFYILFKY